MAARGLTGCGQRCSPHNRPVSPGDGQRKSWQGPRRWVTVTLFPFTVCIRNKSPPARWRPGGPLKLSVRTAWEIAALEDSVSDGSGLLALGPATDPGAAPRAGGSPRPLAFQPSPSPRGTQVGSSSAPGWSTSGPPGQSQAGRPQDLPTPPASGSRGGPPREAALPSPKSCAPSPGLATELRGRHPWVWPRPRPPPTLPRLWGGFT